MNNEWELNVWAVQEDSLAVCIDLTLLKRSMVLYREVIRRSDLIFVGISMTLICLFFFYLVTKRLFNIRYKHH